MKFVDNENCKSEHFYEEVEKDRTTTVRSNNKSSSPEFCYYTIGACSRTLTQKWKVKILDSLRNAGEPKQSPITQVDFDYNRSDKKIITTGDLEKKTTYSITSS